MYHSLVRWNTPLGASCGPVRSVTTQRPPCCGEAKPHGEARNGLWSVALASGSPDWTPDTWVKMLPEDPSQWFSPSLWVFQLRPQTPCSGSKLPHWVLSQLLTHRLCEQMRMTILFTWQIWGWVVNSSSTWSKGRANRMCWGAGSESSSDAPVFTRTWSGDDVHPGRPSCWAGALGSLQFRARVVWQRSVIRQQGWKEVTQKFGAAREEVHLLVPGVSPTETRIYIHQNPTRTLATALFIMAPNQKHSNCPSTIGWGNKL